MENKNLYDRWVASLVFDVFILAGNLIFFILGIFIFCGSKSDLENTIDNKNNKKILEFNIERETLNKSLELLKQKNEKINDELKSYRKTEKNPFKLNEEMNLDNEKKEEKRYSLGGKETRTEKYKMMMLDYENQNKNDLKQLNMLKADIKGLKSKLKDKDKFIGDIKQLIQVGLKGINGGNKTQKEAIKKLKDIFNEV